MTTIPIIVHEAPDAGPKRRDKTKQAAGREERAEGNISIHNIPAETLRSGFEGLVKALEGTLTLPSSIGSFEVEALDIELELTAEGKIGLLGVGGKLGGKGSLTLRLKRPAKRTDA